jgi:hypothetical protein
MRPAAVSLAGRRRRARRNTTTKEVVAVRHHLSADALPLAILWRKGGRDIVLGKVLPLDGQLVLATAYRWRVLPDQVSLPDLAIRLLLRLGVRAWVVRDDLRRLAWRVDLRRLLEAPLRGGERYVRLDDAQPVAWRWWRYAERILDLLELAHPLAEGVSA